MLISYQIYEAIVNHPFYVSIITVVLGYGILHILRKRRQRRDENEVSIPDFLRKGPDSGYHVIQGSAGNAAQGVMLTRGLKPKPNAKAMVAEGTLSFTTTER